MSNLDSIRAWKDPLYRASLSPGDLANMPAHPSGTASFTDHDLRSPGYLAGPVTTSPNCSMFTWVHNHGCCPH